MKDRLGKAKLWNNQFQNKTQNLFTRFVRQPYTGLPDMLEDFRQPWKEFEQRKQDFSLKEL